MACGSCFIEFVQLVSRDFGNYSGSRWKVIHPFKSFLIRFTPNSLTENSHKSIRLNMHHLACAIAHQQLFAQSSNR